MKQSEISRSERRSLLLVQVALLLMVIVGVTCFVLWKGEENKTEQKTEGFSNSKGKKTNKGKEYYSEQKIESFPFDPNTADSSTLSRLGLSNFQIQNIYRYRAKGGRYHRPEEFKKLYGLTVEQWNHLKPLINIANEFKYLSDTPDAYNPARDGYRRNVKNEVRRWEGESDETKGVASSHNIVFRDTTLYPKKLEIGQTIEINMADSNALKRIPGIGHYYAKKIIQYRDKLGGFVSLAQLDDLENIPMGIESYLKLDQTNIKKLRINHCSFRELNNHPYLSYYQTRVIVNHIRQIGPIRSFKDLSLYEEFTTNDFTRLEPYIDFAE